MLTLDEFYGISKNVDVAKGLYKKPTTIKEAKELLIRIYNGR